MTNQPAQWNEKPYYSLNSYLKQEFQTKIYKISLDAGMTCPNRDGTLGTGGCIFCSQGGSGEFAAKASGTGAGSITHQIETARHQVERKTNSGPYIAYFQSFTNTYASLSRLESIFTEAISHPDIAALSIATRPDCLEPEKIRLLQRLNQQKPVWVELGLQTIHPNTAAWIRRGYSLDCFEETAANLKHAGLTVIVHLILGLPGESQEEILESVHYVGHFYPALDGIKLQLLHILEGTDLAAIYRANPFKLFTMEEYIDLVITCLEHLPPSMVIHRLTGDGPKSILIAPFWSRNKRQVLNAFSLRFRQRNTWQGRLWEPDSQ